MSEGSIKDEVSNSYYPDPLSLNYVAFKMKDLPTYRVMDISSVGTLWNTAKEIYGACEWEDIVLTLNGYSHKNFVKEGDTLIFPTLEDINRSFSE